MRIKLIVSAAALVFLAARPATTTMAGKEAHVSKMKAAKSSGLELRIQSSHKWVPGNPFPVNVSVRNRSSKPITLATYGGGGSIYFEMLVLDFEFTYVGGDQRMPIKCRRPSRAILALPIIDPKQLPPGASWETTVNLSEWIPIIKVVIPGGPYEVRAVWQAVSSTGLKNITGERDYEDLYSDPISIDLK